MHTWILALLTGFGFIAHSSIAASQAQAGIVAPIEGLLCGDHLNTVEFRNGLARFTNPDRDAANSVSYLPHRYSLEGLALRLHFGEAAATEGEFTADYTHLLLHVGGPIGVRYLSCTKTYDSQSFTTSTPIIVPAGLSRTPPVLAPALGFIASTLRPEFQGEHCASRVTQVWYTSSPNQNYWQSMIPRTDGTWYFDAIKPYYILFEVSQDTYSATTCTVAFTLSAAGTRPGETYAGSIIYNGGYAASERINLPGLQLVKAFRVQRPSGCQNTEILGAGTYYGHNFSAATGSGTREGIFYVNSGAGLTAHSLSLSLNGPSAVICIIPVYVIK